MTQRPFLLLSTRPEDETAAEELNSFATAMGLPAAAIEQRRVEAAPLGEVRFEDYSGIILGGSPFNNTDLSKSQLQLRVCLLYTSPSPRDATLSRMPSSA